MMFLDTSGLLCYHSKDEREHKEAHRLFKAERHHLTHSYVLAEFVALAQARAVPRGPTLDFCTRLLAHPRLEIVWVEQAIHQDALELLRHRIDKSYSLCDAVSFVLMKRYGIQDALTTDHHFEQEGFIRKLGKTVA
jgi:predicted nucleic acid-binding protein